MRRKDSPKKKSRSPARSRHGSKGSPKKRYPKVEKSETLSSPPYNSPSYPYASSSSTYIPPTLFSPPPPPQPVVPQKEGFFEKHKTVIFVGIALILLAAVGVVLFLILTKPASSPAPSPGPTPAVPLPPSSSGAVPSIVLSDPNVDSFTNNIPINTQFRPQITSTGTSVRFAPPGESVTAIDDHYFGLGKVAYVGQLTFDLILTQSGSIQFKNAIINTLQFYGYISIYAKTGGDTSPYYFDMKGALSSPLDESTAMYYQDNMTLSVSDSTATLDEPISSVPLTSETKPTPTKLTIDKSTGIVEQKLTGIDLTNYLNSANAAKGRPNANLKEGKNTIVIEYASVGSGAIIFDFSFQTASRTPPQKTT